MPRARESFHWRPLTFVASVCSRKFAEARGKCEGKKLLSALEYFAFYRGALVTTKTGAFTLWRTPLMVVPKIRSLMPVWPCAAMITKSG
ncbi:MAG: hypothetical protein RL328_2685 [Acidobacteriota bacterium]